MGCDEDVGYFVSGGGVVQIPSSLHADGLPVILNTTTLAYVADTIRDLIAAPDVRLRVAVQGRRLFEATRMSTSLARALGCDITPSQTRME